jgi:adhesin transport system outer membrane protein
MSHARVRNFRHLLLVACLYGGTAVADGLSDALQATLHNHPAVAGEEAQVDAKRHAADAVRSERYPSLIAQAQQYGEGGRSDSGEDLSQPYIFRVRQPVWAFGRIDNNIAVADAEVSTQRADFLRICRKLLEETAVAYATVRGTAQHIEVARQNVTQLEELFAQIQRRVEGQLASSADARLAAARLAEGKALFERAVSEWEGAKDDLLGFTQVEVDTGQPVSAELLELHESTDLITMAIDQSAEIGVKRRLLGQAEMEVDQARTASMPTIYLQADRYYDQPGLNDDSQASVVFEASLDGMGFAARGRREEAVSSRAAATQDLAAAKVDLTREVKHLQRNRQLQTELVNLKTQSLADLESLLASYQRQYESGTKSWLDLMNVQRELYDQKRQLVEAQTEWQIYSLRLLARVGALDSLAGIQEHSDGE